MKIQEILNESNKVVKQVNVRIADIAGEYATKHGLSNKSGDDAKINVGEFRHTVDGDRLVNQLVSRNKDVDLDDVIENAIDRVVTEYNS